MNRYNGLKHQVLALFASTQGEWLESNEAAERLDFFPARSAWTYFKRLWSFGLLERRSSGRGTLEYRISELGRAASMVTFTGKLTGALRRSSRVRGPTFLVSGLLDLTGGREDALSY